MASRVGSGAATARLTSHVRPGPRPAPSRPEPLESKQSDLYVEHNNKTGLLPYTGTQVNGVRDLKKYSTPVEVSPEVYKVGRKRNLGIARWMPRVRIQAPKLLENPHAIQVTYLPYHIFHPWHEKYLTYSSVTLNSVAIQQYAEKKEPLWWWAQAKPEPNDTANYCNVARMTAAAKLQRAFVQALERHGYDRSGYPLATLPRHANDWAKATKTKPIFKASIRLLGYIREVNDMREDKLVNVLELAFMNLMAMLRDHKPTRPWLQAPPPASSEAKTAAIAETPLALQPHKPSSWRFSSLSKSALWRRRRVWRKAIDVTRRARLRAPVHLALRDQRQFGGHRGNKVHHRHRRHGTAMKLNERSMTVSQHKRGSAAPVVAVVAPRDGMNDMREGDKPTAMMGRRNIDLRRTKMDVSIPTVVKCAGETSTMMAATAKNRGRLSNFKAEGPNPYAKQTRFRVFAYSPRLQSFVDAERIRDAVYARSMRKGSPTRGDVETEEALRSGTERKLHSSWHRGPGEKGTEPTTGIRTPRSSPQRPANLTSVRDAMSAAERPTAKSNPRNTESRRYPHNSPKASEQNHQQLRAQVNKKGQAGATKDRGAAHVKPAARGEGASPESIEWKRKRLYAESITPPPLNLHDPALLRQLELKKWQQLGRQEDRKSQLRADGLRIRAARPTGVKTRMPLWGADTVGARLVEIERKLRAKGSM